MITDKTTLVAALRNARKAEEAAKAERNAIEAQLVSLFTAPSGGEGTIKDDGFSITWKATRKVDSDALFAAWNSLTPNGQQAFRFKAEVALSHFRAVQELDESTFSQIAQFVTTTPAKPAITLKD